MERTVENCSLIKVNVESGRGKPEFVGSKCKGYVRRGKLHQVCKKCKIRVKEEFKW